MNFIKEQLAIWKLKASLCPHTRPDRAFLESAKLRFVTMAQQRAGVTLRAKHPRGWKYATIAVVAVLALTSGVAVFADANNVPVTHPLYNLKRLSEQVRLDLSSAPQQVELHRMFAKRRLEEAGELVAGQDTRPIPPQAKTRIEALDKDFQNETETGLDKADTNSQVQASAREHLCHDIMDVAEHGSSANHLPSALLDHLKLRCAHAPGSQKD